MAKASSHHYPWKKTMKTSKDKLTDDIVADKVFHRSGGTQHATGKLLRFFQSTSGLYDTAILKPLGYLVANI